MLFIITLTGTSTAKYIQKILPVAVINLISHVTAKKDVQIFTIHSGNSSSISRLFHSSFNFQRGNAGLQNVGENVHTAHVFQTEWTEILLSE